jgi:murein tripeptide amidase MpaA
MPPKKTTVPEVVLAPLDTNQDGILLREARSQKRKAAIPTLQDEELDQEISNHEAIHRQVEKRREKMLRLSEFQKKIDKVAKEMQHIAHDTEH